MVCVTCVPYISDLNFPIDLSVPSLLKRWKRLEIGLDLSADAFDALSKRFKNNTEQWLKTEKHAQASRHEDPSVMDIYDTVTKKSTEGMEAEYLQHILF